MMEQAVVIKSNRYGLTVILDDQMPFEELQQKVAEKFAEAKKFFKGAEMAVAFEGRELSQEQQIHLVNVIIQNANIKVPCIVDVDEARETLMKQAVAQVSQQPRQEISQEINDGKFYKGTLRSGQVLESETSIIILGDVNPGAKVISKGNVVVLGTLKGNIYVGASGNENAFVAALAMDPMQIRIADYIARNSDEAEKGKKRKSKKAEEPMIAYVDGGNIYIEPITKEVIGDINI